MNNERHCLISATIESADEEIAHSRPNAHVGPSRRNYVTVSDDDGELRVSTPSSGKTRMLRTIRLLIRLLMDHRDESEGFGIPPFFIHAYNL
jgi:hypothetical protein